MLLSVSGVACGQSGPTPITTPLDELPDTTSTPVPTAPVITSPTVISTSIPVSKVTQGHMPGMVLTQEDIDTVLSNLALTGERFQSHDDVARITIDPADAPSNLQSRGFLDGYERTFQDSSDLFSLTVSASVYRWDTSNSAKAFIRTEVADLRRLNGNQLQEGIALTDYEELTPPDVGTTAVASRHTVNIEAFDSKINTTLALWQRETIVASIRILASSDGEMASVIGQLSTQMNERIDEVISGKTPPSPVPTQKTNSSEASPGNLKLSSMLLNLGDLPADAVIRQEGPLEVSGASEAYQRRFMPRGAIVKFPNSEVTEIQTTVGVFDDAETARVPVEVLRSLGPEGAGQLISQGFAGGTGIASDSISVELLDFPTIGDDSYSLLLHMKTAVANLEGHLVYFVRGRVRAQFVVFGLAGKLSVEDTIPLAHLVDQRIQSSPP